MSDTSPEGQPDQLAPTAASILERLFVWGWCVYDCECGEGIDCMLPTLGEAEAYAAATYGPEDGAGLRIDGDGTEYEDIEIFPALSGRRPDADEDRVYRLTREEIEALGICKAMLVGRRAGS
jgi:hypothetical protein